MNTNPIYTDPGARLDAIAYLVRKWTAWYDSPASYKASTYDQAFYGAELLDIDPDDIPNLDACADEMDEVAMTGAGLVEVAEILVDWAIEAEAMRL